MQFTDGTAEGKLLSLKEAYKRIEELEDALAKTTEKLKNYFIVKELEENWGDNDIHTSSAPNVDGYKSLCWVNFTSVNCVVPCYTNNSTKQENTSVFSYNPSESKKWEVRCIAMYIRED